MAIRPSDVRPLELARNSILVARESWMQILFAGGIFVLLAQLIIFVSKASGIPMFVTLGDTAGAFTMFLATVAVSLVTSARVLGIQIPYLPSALINDQYFWRYVWGALVAAFLAGLAAIAFGLVALTLMSAATGQDSVQAVIKDPVRIVGGIGLVSMIPWLFVHTRLFMLLPAVAAGEKVSASASWRRTHGVAIKLAISLVLAIGGFLVAEFVFKTLAGHGGDPTSTLLLTVLAIAVKIFRCAVEGALAGFVFAMIFDSEEA